MELLKIWTLRGANRWARVPVLEIELSVSEQSRYQLENLRDLALDLQRQCGRNVHFGQVHSRGEPRQFRVIMEFEEESLAHACLTLALELCRGQPVDFP